MRIFYFLFFISISVVAQNPPIELRIDSITSSDSIPTERSFAINYHIENLTDNEVSFLLYPKSITPNMRGSLSKGILYKIYQNEEFLDLENIFINKKMEDFNKRMEEAKTQKEKDSILEKFFKDEMNLDIDSVKKKDEKTLMLEDRKLFLSSIITIKPKERISFSKTLFWNKIRYYKIEDNEFYINEDLPHYLEFTINLTKEEFKNHLETEEYQKIIANPNYIIGWFSSNKMELNMKE